MYLLDTNVVSELRKRTKTNSGVKAFFKQTKSNDDTLFLSVITVGELRRGVDLIRYRGDIRQASRLEAWLSVLLEDFHEQILPFGVEEAHVWGKLRVPKHENALDKQIAATAILYGLTLVTRNEKDFHGLGVQVLNPFN